VSEVRTASAAPSVSAAVPERADLGFIKTKVGIEDVAAELGIEVRRHRARCWWPERHRNGDADPSVRFHVKKNRVRCFGGCHSIGAISNIDLVMEVLGCDFPSAVYWICERFPVPSAKRGSPVGPRSRWPQNYRFGTSGSELELLARSGMWAQFTTTQKKILPVLLAFRDEETGLTEISYRGLMRYAGVGSPKSIARAVWGLHGLHALQAERGQRVGVVRGCSRYRLTLEDPEFLRLLNAVHLRQREEIERERAFRAEARLSRNRPCAKFPITREEVEEPRLQVAVSGRVGGVASLRPCTGKVLCSANEAPWNKPLHHSEARGLKTMPDGGYEPPSEAECLRRAQEQKAQLKAYLAGLCEQEVERCPRAQSVSAEQEAKAERPAAH